MSDGSARPAMPGLLSFRAAIFMQFAKACRALPAFRGKVRFFLLVYAALGLKKHHVQVDARLSGTVPYRAKLDLHSWLQRIAFLTGKYESGTVTFLHRLWRSGDGRGYVLDVGANIGLISIPVALIMRNQADGERLVVSVEAVPDNCRSLDENIRLNGLGSEIAVIRAALGDSVKTIEIQVEGDLAAGEGTGTANILPDGSAYPCVRQTLELETLDRLLEDGTLPSKCSAIKIDTDGYDLKVLQGGPRFLALNRPVILGEFSSHCMGWHGQSIRDIEEFAHAHRYLVWQRVPPSWLFSERTDPDAYKEDLLLVPEESRAQFAWCLVAEPQWT